MRLLMLFYDHIYLEAFLKASARHHKDLCLVVVDSTEDLIRRLEACGESKGSILQDALLLTDYHPSDIPKFLRELLKDHIVCFTEYPVGTLEHSEGFRQVFRYQRFSKILADLMLCMNDLSGNLAMKDSSIIAVLSDGSVQAEVLYDSYSSFLLKLLAENEDHRVLSFDLRALRREPGCDMPDYEDENRLMMARYYYDVVARKRRDKEGFFIQDEAMIFHFRGGRGFNSLTELSEEERREVLHSMESGLFDFIVYDIGSEYTRENLEVIRHADILIFVVQHPDDEQRLLSDIFPVNVKRRPVVLVASSSDIEERMIPCAEEHLKIIMSIASSS